LDRQECIGPGDRHFKLLEFRTGESQPEQTTSAWNRKTTRVGQWLRYTRIDILPQFVNVLRGDISLIEVGASPNPFSG
jgi:lipopolysaccharide/colanic/teichoic acid biosynthesis glycosyltransferase